MLGRGQGSSRNWTLLPSLPTARDIAGFARKNTRGVPEWRRPAQALRALQQRKRAAVIVVAGQEQDRESVAQPRLEHLRQRLHDGLEIVRVLDLEDVASDQQHVGFVLVAQRQAPAPPAPADRRCGAAWPMRAPRCQSAVWMMRIGQSSLSVRGSRPVAGGANATSSWFIAQAGHGMRMIIGWRADGVSTTFSSLRSPVTKPAEGGRHALPDRLLQLERAGAAEHADRRGLDHLLRDLAGLLLGAEQDDALRAHLRGHALDQLRDRVARASWAPSGSARRA